MQTFHAGYNFLCNICDSPNVADVCSFSRETGFCTACRSTVRMRSAVHALSMGLYGQSLSIKQFPRLPKFCGIGLSDWPIYARRLRRVLNYRNTFFDKKPQLDITNDISLSLRNKYDFLISIDVFEHVKPPVMKSFEGVNALLRAGGIFVLSVPYSHAENTQEHFPELHEFTIASLLGELCLVNRRKDG